MPGSQADIKLNSSIVSRNHGVIYKENGVYSYRDNGSLNGTFINGVLFGIRDDASASCILHDGDVIRIDRRSQSASHPEALIMIFRLGEKDTVWTKQAIGENSGDISIGRAVEGNNSVHLSDEAISRNHATFRRGISGWAVVDHGSTNGVFVNQRRITQATALSPLDVVRIAGIIFVYTGDSFIYDAESVRKQALEIHIRERSVKSHFKKKILLQDIDLKVEEGEMVLILGGSGAGKSTFLNAVMGYEKADAVIRHGDVDIYKEYSKMKHRIGFVPQQDLIRGEDTVIATISNAAAMKLPKKMPAQEKQEKIDETLEMLGLSKEKKTLVNKLSGGQKKRLSIAIELISDPALFFLDEPDSGLDGIMAVSLMENLRVIADEGKVVMIITHGPDRVADLFDKVIVLAKSIKTNSGQLAFFGSIPEALAHFGTDSLEGVVKKINRVDEGGEGLSDYYIDLYKQMKEAQ